MTDIENAPREKGSIPEGAILQPDGSYVLPDEVLESQATVFDEDGSAPPSEQAAVDSPPRELGSPAPQGQSERASQAPSALNPAGAPQTGVVGTSAGGDA